MGTGHMGTGHMGTGHIGTGPMGTGPMGTRHMVVMGTGPTIAQPKGPTTYTTGGRWTTPVTTTSSRN